MKSFLELFLTSSLFIVTIILIRAVFQKKINVHLQYALWLLVAMKLLLFPIPQIPSILSVQSVLRTAIQQIQEAWQDGGLQQKSDASRHEDGASTDYQTPDKTSGNTDNVTDAVSNGQERFLPAGREQDSSLAGSQQASHSQAKDSRTADRHLENSVLAAQTVWRLGTVIAALGSIVMLMYFVIGNLRFAKYLHKKRICQSQSKFPLPIYVVDGLPSPCLYGRAVYLTPGLAEDSVRSRHVLMHEYCHYRQGDLVWSAIRCLCVICYWWNPFVWLAAALSKQDCELSCDQAALRRLGENERMIYGETLLSLLRVTDKPKDYFSIAAFMKGTFKKGGAYPMKRRIQGIAHQNKTALPVCLFAAVLSMACFISVSTTTPTAENGVQNTKTKTAVDSSQQPDNMQKELQQPKATTQQQPSEETKGVFDLDQAVADMLLADNKGSYAAGECVAEGHIILGSKQRKNGSTKVYTLTMYGEYAFQNGCFIKESGSGVIPAVMVFRYDSSLGYVPKACKYPTDGDGYLASIQEMFPKHLQKRCIQIRQADEKNLIRQERVYAKKYLKNIGRKAKIGAYRDIEHPLLTDAGVSVEVSNSLYSGEMSFLYGYPDWIGDLERVEQGVRYRYALELDKKSREIIYTKSVYETGDIVEDIRIDMDTGKLKSYQTYPEPGKSRSVRVK